ncbi:MAG: T9SS type A sorting domain-containing protein [Flavobacteriales bacterium]|nr:T9SS type A sorting domain-containing protein [Flavobacteriales bacterium]
MKVFLYSLFSLTFLFPSTNIKAQYCTSNATSTSDSRVENVQLAGNTITLNNNSSASGCVTYTDFTTGPNVPDLLIGNAYTVNITQGTCNGNYNRTANAWIDFNQDNDFADAGEMLGAGTFSTNAAGYVHSYAFTVPGGAIAGNTIMRIIVSETGTCIDPCAVYSWGETEDYTVNIQAVGPMAYVSTTTTQNNTSSVQTCATNQEIIGVEIVTSGSTSPFNATSFRVRTNGSTSPAITANVTNIDIYYTGNSSTYAPTTLFGSAVPQNAGTNININGSQTLTSGTNYFWVVYDINAAATIGHVLDAQCTRITMNGGVGNQIPTVTAPAGNRTIAICDPSPGGVSITNVKSWFKVDNYTNGSTTWNNSVPNANIPSLNAIVAPLYSATNPVWNYNPLLTFNGSITTDNFQVSFPAVTDILSVNEGSIIVVGTYPGSGGLGACGYFGSPGVNNDEFSSQCIGTWYRGSNVTGTWTAATTPMNNTPSIHTSKFIRSGSTTNISTFYNSYSNGTNSNSAGFSTVSPHEYGIGVIPHAHDFEGSITEAITTSNNLTLSERTRIESYLAVKYGITLDNTGGGTQGDYTATDGSIIWDASVNASYYNDIIGIGRDDNQSLLQKQSHTIDDTTRIYLNTLQTTNAANTGSFSNDVAYIVVGNNKGVIHNTAAANAEVPVACGLYSRLAREWKITNTNFTDNFNFDVKLNAGANPTSVTVSDLRLLVDDDGNFANGGTTCYYNGDGTGIVISYANPVITVSGISNTHITNSSTKYITIGSIDAATPLPVDLLSYTASCKDNLPLLEWTTTTEINNDYFTIEKSTDGIYFDEVAIINGNGNSSLPINYSWLDEKPTNQTAYYRLKQTDFNGAFQYYGIEAIACKQEGSISIYPNPFDDGFTVNLDKNTTYPLTLEIYDYLGRKVFEQQIITNNTNIILGEKVTKGTYSVKIFNNTSQVVNRMIKTK